MQDYRDFAAKNGLTLEETGPCPLCGGAAERAVHECVEIFELGYGPLDLREPRFRFHIVDAHALQHPELHGRWSNHFHLARLCLVVGDGVHWTYRDSPRLSGVLDRFKKEHPDARLVPPPRGHRGTRTAADVRAAVDDPVHCKAIIEAWAQAVHRAWRSQYSEVDAIRTGFLADYR